MMSEFEDLVLEYGGGVKFQVVGRELCPQRLVLVQEAA